jgi:hypothetical protein
MLSILSATDLVNSCSTHEQCVNLNVRQPFVHLSFGSPNIKLLLLVKEESFLLRFLDARRNEARMLARL